MGKVPEIALDVVCRDTGDLCVFSGACDGGAVYVYAVEGVCVQPVIALQQHGSYAAERVQDPALLF